MRYGLKYEPTNETYDLKDENRVIKFVKEKTLNSTYDVELPKLEEQVQDRICIIDLNKIASKKPSTQSFIFSFVFVLTNIIFYVLDANFEAIINKMNPPFAYFFDVDSNGHMYSIHAHFKHFLLTHQMQ